MKKKNGHDFEHLLNWVEGRLPATETKELKTQLETADSDTQALLEWVREFQRLTQKYQLASPPESLDESLYNIFTKQIETKRRPHFFQRLLAALTFDSYQQLPLSGVRAAAAQKSERQLVYSADAIEITLDLQWLKSEKQIRVNGQLFPDDETDETSYLVELQKEHETLTMVQTDELGKFIFPALPLDTYDIILSGDQLEIELTGVEFRF
jgi:hypothetical protein